VKPRLENKVIVVTGGARGIGAAVCEEAAREGGAVVVTDLLDDEGEALARKIRASGGRARYARLDVSSERDWTEALARAASEHGGLHALVNNAAFARNEGVEEETVDGMNRLLAVNLTGAWLGMKTAIPHLRRAGGGSIVNVSSIYGTIGGNGAAVAYHASKGALRIMTKNAAIRYAKEKIRVNSVNPGFIDTPMIHPFMKDEAGRKSEMARWIEGMTPMGRVGTPEEVAGAVVFLASDAASYMTGSEVYVDGGWTAA
jgi:NAD(P)-dependent dehydrogenase (short-subunit alcohol dehydrogenase family)